MGKTQTIGQIGENLAADYLNAHSLEILERNWHSERAEIDIIAMERTTLVFVEVKTRTSDWFEHPSEAVNSRKRQLMIRAGQSYMRKIGHDWAIRFDIISIVLPRDAEDTAVSVADIAARGGYIEHQRDAFFPSMG